MKRISYLKDLTLLLVDDDEQILNDLKETLGIFFKSVLTCTDGEKAYKLYKSTTIDVVITDYVMPLMSGYELCKKIREETLTIPLVIMSNFTEKEKLLNSISLNLVEYVVKPIDYHTLIATLEKIVSRMSRENMLVEQIDENLAYNHAKKVLINNGEIVTLTKNEIYVLELLLKNKNSLVSHDTLELNMSDENILSRQAIKNIIFRFRKKIGKNIITNVNNMGYILGVR